MIRRGSMARFAGMFLMTAAPLTGIAGQGLTVSGSPTAMVVHSATAGLSPAPAVESSTSYTVSTDSAASRISARIDAHLPAGLELRAQLEAPPGATGMGEISLTTFDQDLVRGIPSGSYAGLNITYRLLATSAAGTLSPSTRSVVLTLVEGS